VRVAALLDGSGPPAVTQGPRDACAPPPPARHVCVDRSRNWPTPQRMTMDTYAAKGGVMKHGDAGEHTLLVMCEHCHRPTRPDRIMTIHKNGTTERVCTACVVERIRAHYPEVDQ
jgi:hypothetical protein